MTRREEREHIFKLLFLTEFYKEEELAPPAPPPPAGPPDAPPAALTHIRKPY